MPAKIQRRIQAARDVEETAEYIAKDSLEAALRFLQQTKSTLQYLAENPGIGGRFVSDHPEFENLRACRVKGFPNHVIFYIEREGAIEIVRILHGAMDLEAELRKSE